MKFKILRQLLSDTVSNISRFVSAKSSVSALEGILLKVKDNNLSLSGYDLETGASVTIECNAIEPGEIILTAKLFFDIIRKMPGEFITVECGKKFDVVITSEHTTFNLLGIPAEEFPELPSVNTEKSFNINGNILSNMIRKTIFAVSQNESKPVYTGILFEIEEDYMNLVALDGFRLALCREEIKFSYSTKFVVPSKTLAEIVKLAVDFDDDITISIGKRQIIFVVNGYSVYSRILDGDFSDYASFIPNEIKTEILVNKRSMCDCVERASLLINERLKSPVKCEFNNNSLKLSCVTAIGKINDEIELKIKGEDVLIGFNNRYLIDALKNVDEDEVKLLLNGPLAPMKIKPIEGDSFLYLVLPLRMKND
jgi:DNA polymerase III, beta subunit